MAKITVNYLLEMLQQQGGRCALSGRELSPENCVLDHIDAAANGGSLSYGNVQLVREEVNRAKGTMTMEEFVAMCEDIANARRKDLQQA